MYKLSGLNDQLFNLKKTELQPLLEGLRENLHSKLQESGADLKIDCPHTISCEPSLLLQGIENLVANAIKFSGDEPKVMIRSYLEDGRVTFSIEDNGPGIPPPQRSRIFDAFSRPEEMREKEGLGLGLSTVKKIVELHQGVIEVLEGEEWKGACFRISFPSMPLTVELLGLEEREEDFLEVLLQEKGHSVVRRPAGERPERDCDIVLLDWEGNFSSEGWEEARSWGNPLLALGPHDQSIMNKVLRDGAAEYLSRPFSPEAALERIELAMDELF
jgi:two-component sensor histidine kinase